MKPTAYTAILPIYLQKYIIKILCEYIDNFNKTYKKKLIQDRNPIPEEIVSFSLVNKCWFNTFSQNLSISVDFIAHHHFKNDTERKNRPNMYDRSNILSHFIIKRLNNQTTTTTTSNCRLLKDENIKELVLNLRDWGVDYGYYGNDKSPHIKIVTNKLNQVIKSRFINLERIKTTSGWFKYMENIEFNNIKIDFYSTGSNLKSPSTNLKEINSLYMWIGSFKNSESLQFLKSLNSVGSLHSDYHLNFKYLYDNGVGNCFKNTKKIITQNIIFQNLAYSLILAPNVSKYHIQICFDNLIYQLNDGYDIGNIKQQQQQCKCSFNYPKFNINFKEHWQQFSESIINHKHLKVLTILHGCVYSLTEEEAENENEQTEMINTTLSIQLIDQLQLIFSNNKSITEFYLENVLDYSSRNNVLNKFKKFN